MSALRGESGGRRRKTTRSVYVAERTAKSLITVGGVGTILAVLGICVFLVWVVLPLFRGADVREVHTAATAGRADAEVVATGVDEHRVLTWELDAAGVLRVRAAVDGTLIETRAVVPGRAPTAIAHDASFDTLSLGFEDGTVRFASVSFATRLLDPDELPAETRDRASGLAEGEALVDGDGVLQSTPGGKLRRQSLDLVVGEAFDTEHASPVLRIDHSGESDERLIAALHEDGHLGLLRVRSRVNRMTDEVTMRVERGDVPYVPATPPDPPAHLRISGTGSTLYLLWRDGRLERFDTRDLKDARLAEDVDVLADSEAEVTRVGMAIGKTSLLVGDGDGRVGVWFPIRPSEGAGTVDAIRLVRGKVLEPPQMGSAVRAIAPSARSRLVAVGYESGYARLFFATSAASLGDVEAPAGEPVVALAFAPKEDALVASTASGSWTAEFDARHPEASLRGIFGRVWYEGYERPEHAWQSSGGDRRVRAEARPGAARVRDVQGDALLDAVRRAARAAGGDLLERVPLAAGARPGQVGHRDDGEPAERRARLPRRDDPRAFRAVGGARRLRIVPDRPLGAAPGRVPVAAPARRGRAAQADLAHRHDRVVHPLGLAAAFLLGPGVERLLFSGDITTWLDGQVGGPFGGWFVLFLPLVAFAVAVFGGRVVQPWLRGVSMGLGPRQVRPRLTSCASSRPGRWSWRSRPCSPSPSVRPASTRAAPCSGPTNSATPSSSAS